MSSNSNLTKAKKVKNDEFYTQYVDIEKELKYYNIEGRTIYCNCDNPAYSNFYKYFKDNFHIHKIKQLYCTGYNSNGNGYYAEYDGSNEVIRPLNGDGDFRSEECIKILQKVDTVITNPPFSIFRGYIKQLIDFNKDFLVIGNKNAITYKEIFPYIKNNELCLGNTIPNDYYLPNGEVTQRLKGLCRWFTNIPCIAPKQPLILTKTYNSTDYPKYDNYDAIEVSNVKNIPIDYNGVMGVPITFLDKYSPIQFEIIWIACGSTFANAPKEILDDLNFNPNIKYGGGLGAAIVDGTPKYSRILIKRNNSLEPVEFEILDAREHTNNDNLKCKSTYLVKDKDGSINGRPTYVRILIKKKLL